jgi:hypothetical protein
MSSNLNANCMKKEDLFAYACRMLEPPEEAAIGAHVAGCAACRMVVESYERLNAVLDESRPVEPSPWFDARLHGRIAASEAPSRLTFFGRFGLDPSRLWAPALAVVLVVTAALVLVRVRPDRRPARNRVATQAVARRNAGAPAASPTLRDQGRAQARAGTAASETGKTNSPPSREVAGTVEQPAEVAGALTAAAPPDEVSHAEDDDMLAGFDVLLELPKPGKGTQVDNNY